MSIARILVLGVVLLSLVAGSWGRAGMPGTPRVEAVLSGLDLRLEDGRTLRLAGIRTPKAVEGPARDALTVLVLDQRIRLFPEHPPIDRWGRLVAEVERTDGRSLQGALLERGLAVVEPGPEFSDPEHLFAAERVARAAGQGVWSTGLVLPADPARLQPGFAIVRGDVRQLARTRSAAYLNFDEPWWSDFTLKVGTAAIERAFEAAGWPLEALVGRTVEVRGFIVEAGGPLIELFQPDQLEVVR